MKSTRTERMAAERELLIAEGKRRMAVMAGAKSNGTKQIAELKRRIRRLKDEAREP